MVWENFLLRVALAMILGAMIGTERQLRQRLAGLRTNALVASGASLFVLVSAYTGDVSSDCLYACSLSNALLIWLFL